MDLLLGTLDLLVLRALSFGPAHGYAVARFIRQGSGETFRILDGALYTSLHRLEGRGAVTSHWGLSDRGKRAKFYELTVIGKRELSDQTASWTRYTAAVGKVLHAIPQAS
ncbi:MAG: PadR family transcriptional regulator [Gemmatimonadales bacterium]